MICTLSVYGEYWVDWGVIDCINVCHVIYANYYMCRNTLLI